MASRYSRIPRALNELKFFLDYHSEEYKDALRHIKPSEGWNIPYYNTEIYQLPIEMHGNLYEGIYPKLTEDNPAPDEEIITLLKGCLIHFENLNKVFGKIVKTKRKNKEKEVLWTAEGIVSELLLKAIFKLKEVIKLAEEDLLRYSEDSVSNTQKHESDKDQSDNYLIGIITATTLEFNATFELIDNATAIPTQPNDSQIYYEGHFAENGKRIKVILTQCHHQGTAAASTTTTKLILRFKPDIVVMLGHAAGNKNLLKEINIGDILISSTALDYDQVTVIERTNNGNKPEIREKDRKVPISADSTLVQLLTNFCSESKLKKIKSEYDEQNIFKPPLTFKVGLMVSGDALVRSENWFHKIVSDNAGAIGLDMETYGVYYASVHALFKNKPLFISIKSVSDFGSHRTDYPEEISDNNIRVRYAANTSAKLFYEFALEHLPV